MFDGDVKHPDEIHIVLINVFFTGGNKVLYLQHLEDLLVSFVDQVVVVVKLNLFLDTVVFLGGYVVLTVDPFH